MSARQTNRTEFPKTGNSTPTNGFNLLESVAQDQCCPSIPALSQQFSRINSHQTPMHPASPLRPGMTSFLLSVSRNTVSRSLVACGVLLFLAGCATQNAPQPQQPRLISLEKSLSSPRSSAAEDSSLDALISRYTAKQQRITASLPRSGLASDHYDEDQLSDNALVSSALEHLGVRYKWGGNNPDTGFDCSGLVVYAALQSLGLQLPRSTSELAHAGTAVSRQELQPGDLVFFNTLGRRYSHVGIYVGDNQFVHAPNSRGVVRIEKMDMRYWSKRFNGARRLTASVN